MEYLSSLTISYITIHSSLSFFVACDYGQIFEPQERAAVHQYMIDAGCVINSPYPLLLRPQRAVDIILSFDFSLREKEDEELLDVSYFQIHFAMDPL